MRTTFLFLTTLAFALTGFTSLGAQELGQELTLTGCLVQEDEEEDEVEFLLEGWTDEEITVEEIELAPGEGVDPTPHVGHTVEVTGVVVADDDEETEPEEEEEEEEDEDDELHIRVAELRHIEASCGEAR